mmetsp:Transcript_22401/g.88938  ORF Transcript_22401/g.88938 Transcript_22401/m.88938 type:complete len:270 (+) Transcript_22401:17-826(+)
MLSLKKSYVSCVALDHDALDDENPDGDAIGTRDDLTSTTIRNGTRHRPIRPFGGSVVDTEEPERGPGPAAEGGGERERRRRRRRNETGICGPRNNRRGSTAAAAVRGAATTRAATGLASAPNKGRPRVVPHNTHPKEAASTRRIGDRRAARARWSSLRGPGRRAGRSHAGRPRVPSTRTRPRAATCPSGPWRGPRLPNRCCCCCPRDLLLVAGARPPDSSSRVVSPDRRDEAPRPRRLVWARPRRPRAAAWGGPSQMPPPAPPAPPDAE